MEDWLAEVPAVLEKNWPRVREEGSEEEAVAQGSDEVRIVLDDASKKRPHFIPLPFDVAYEQLQQGNAEAPVPRPSFRKEEVMPRHVHGFQRRNAEAPAPRGFVGREE